MKLKIAIDPHTSFCLAYFWGRWVAVPLFFPDETQDPQSGDLSQTRFIPENAEPIKPIETRSNDCACEAAASSVKESIVPWLMPRKELKELCKKNDIPFFWVTGICTRKSMVKNDGLRRENRKCHSCRITSKLTGR